MKLLILEENPLPVMNRPTKLCLQPCPTYGTLVRARMQTPWPANSSSRAFMHPHRGEQSLPCLRCEEPSSWNGALAPLPNVTPLPCLAQRSRKGASSRPAASVAIPEAKKGAMASVLAPSDAPPTQDGKKMLHSALLRRGASALLTLPSVSAPARSVVQKRGMTIVRKFGGAAVGLSVTGSSFAAPLPSLDEAVASGARVPTATELRPEPPVVALVDGAVSGHRPDTAPPPGSSWTTVDVGDRGLVDAVLDTLVHAHRRWGRGHSGCSHWAGQPSHRHAISCDAAARVL